MKKKKNYDITHRVMRVLAGDYALLMEISRRADIPMATALHKLIMLVKPKPEPDPEPAASKSPAQISMTPTPAIRVTGVPAFRVPGKPAIQAIPVTSTATNGSKSAAFRIKTGRVKYD
ncbi:hypothetical protein ES705_44408 [subsurface metagenome]